MANQWFFRWHHIGGPKPVQIASFRAQPICYSGIRFSGSAREVYWHTIQLYLRKKISEFFDEVEAQLTSYPPVVRAAALNEARMLVGAFARRIREEAIERDRILRGNGIHFPKRQDLGRWLGSQAADIESRASELKAIYCGGALLPGGAVMPIQSLLKDKVTLIKKDGTIVREDFPASVQSGRIITTQTDIPIEPGDKIARHLPNGLTEYFVVDDPGYHSGLHGIPASYQMRVHRSDAPPRQPHTVINNVSGNNARVNMNAVDNSQNITHQNSDELFRHLADTLRAAVTNADDRELLLRLVSEMAAGTKDGTYTSKYQRFIASLGAHVAIIAPFLPALTQLLH
ncbi:MAG TPA: hypothetical protein VGM17_07555 [Rhizomicrobium sp.]